MTTAAGPPAVSRRAALLAAVSTLTTACTADRRPDRSDPAGAADIVVGASLELSGPAAAVGVLQERALRITAEQLNAEGVAVGGTRRAVRLVVRDNAGRVEIATADARQLIDRDRVLALVGGTLAETSLATIAVAQERGVPLVSLANADEIVQPTARRSFVYKVTPDSADIARQLARLIDRQKLLRVAVLASRNAYGESGIAAMQGALDAAGLELVRAVRLPAAADELPDTARRVAGAGAEAVVIWATAPTSGRVAQSLRATGFAGRFFLDPGAVAEVTLAGDTAPAMEGAYLVHPATLDTSSLRNTTTAGLDRRAFVYRYIQLHGPFTGFAPYASDALTLITTAAQQAGRLDHADVRARLETMTMEGIAGSYAFTADSHGGMDAQSLAVFTVERGAWVRTSS